MAVVLARDGLPARPSGSWAQEKPYYIERYMQIVSQGMKWLWSSRAQAP